MIAISTLIVSRWFRAGTFIATGDMGPFIRQGRAGSRGFVVLEPADHWRGLGGSHDRTGTGFFPIWLSGALGFDETVAQWMFYTLIYGLVAFGVAYGGRHRPERMGIVLAGTFAVMNGFFLTRIPNPLNIISVGTLALLTGIALRVAQGRTVPTPIAGFAFMPIAFLAFNPPMFVVAAFWASVFALVLVWMLYGWRAFRACSSGTRWQFPGSSR